MNTAIYKIEALTNMHVGSGDANYGVIDNLIQRDVTTEFPTINGSSLKGAIKEYFENQNFDIPKLNEIFGDEKGKAGYKFLSAKLLAIPVRSNKKPYYLATCPSILKQLKEDAKNFGFSINVDSLSGLNPAKGKPIVFTDDTKGLLIEDFGGNNQAFDKNEKPGNCSIFTDCENLVIFNDDDFKELTNDFNLPVIARNKVGEDKNLWYEQVVPRKSLFYFIVLHDNNHFSDFETILQKEVVHIGANATVGYGFTKISKI